MKPVAQEETTGCGIASVANIVGKTYSEMKDIANAMGIFATDESLWSDTQHVRKMLSKFGIEVVLDSASYLSSNIRTDFDEMQPKWFIEVKTT